jgi:hypothetical protein
MTSAPVSPDEASRLLRLARSDRKAAEQALAALTPEVQAALVCETPLDRRSDILGMLSAPETVIPLIPEAELCFIVKAIGLADATWMLEYATSEQIVASVDLDAWNGYAPDISTANAWLEAFSRTSDRSFFRAVSALDSEMLVLMLKSQILSEQKPAGDDDWQPPEGGQTLEGQFYYTAIEENTDLESITKLLRMLFENDYWRYFRLMLAVNHELDSDNVEFALRWRSGRLEDLGFPSWDESMQIYKFLAPAARAAISDDERPFDVEGWQLPTWIPRLPDVSHEGQRIFDAIAGLRDEERLASFYAFIAVANKTAVADRLPLGDAESMPCAIAKTARLMSSGLAHVATENALGDSEVLSRVRLEHLFRVGANLDPESARPTR